MKNMIIYLKGHEVNPVIGLYAFMRHECPFWDSQLCKVSKSN